MGLHLLVHIHPEVLTMMVDTKHTTLYIPHSIMEYDELKYGGEIKRK